MSDLLRKEFVEEELRWWNIPGVEIGAVETDALGKGHTLQCRGYGLRDVERGLPMTPGTLGGIASCSKAFTSAVVASLVDEGVLDYDRPVREYLPDFALMDPFASKECCLRDMLYHRTGIAGHDAMWPNPGWSPEEFIHRVRYLAPNRPFRSVAQYSNTIYDLIGFIAEKVSGQPYEQLVRDRIFAPLHMTRSNLSLAQTQADPDWAAGYFAEEIGRPENTDVMERRSRNQRGADRRTAASPDPEAYRPRRMEGWDMNRIGNPAAGVNSCAQDMLHWITLHLNNGVYEDKRLFSENVMRQMHEAAVSMSAFPWRFPEVPGYGFYGMAWKTAIYRGMTMTYHCGEIEGYSSITMFLPDYHFGMFVLCNRHTMCTPFLLELVYTAIDSYLGFSGRDPVSWAERLHPYARDFTGSCADWRMDLMPEKEQKEPGAGEQQQKEPGTGEEQQAAPAADAGRTTADCAALAGTYVSDAYGPLRITCGTPAGPIGVSYMRDGREPSPVSLYLHFKNWILPLEPRPDLGSSTYCVRNLKEDTLFYRTPLVFTQEKGEPGFTLKLEKEVPAIFFRRSGE